MNKRKTISKEKVLNDLKVLLFHNKYIKNIKASDLNIQYSMYFAIELTNNYTEHKKNIIIDLFKIVLQNKPSTKDKIIIAQYLSSSKLNEIQWAKDIYNKTLLEDDDNYISHCEVAKSISNKKYLNDIVWSKNIYLNIINNVKDDFDIYMILNEILKNDNLDSKWLKYIIVIISIKIKEFNTISILWDEFFKIDKKFTKTYLKSLVIKTTNCNHLIQIASFISDVDYFNDKEWSESIYKKALDNYETNIELLNIISSILTNFNDTEFAIELLNDDIKKYKENHVGYYINDEFSVKEYFRNIIDENISSTNIYEIVRIIKIISSKCIIKDNNFLIELYNKILNNYKDKSINNYVFIFKNMMDDIENLDKKFIEKQLKNLIANYQDVDDLYYISEYILDKEYLNDKVLKKDIFKLILSELDEDKNISYMYFLIIKKILSNGELKDNQWATLIYENILLKARTIDDVIEIARNINDGLNNKLCSKTILSNPYKYLL